MEPKEALNLLDQAVSQINGPRQLHVQLQQSIECLRILVSKIKELKEKNGINYREKEDE